jgi:hypothetical protein
MRIPSLSKATLGACVFALTLSVTPRPADAGVACDELDRDSPCITSSDLKSRLDLDEDGKQGRLRVMNRDGDSAVELNASSGNLTNLFSNEANKSNGLVKAWAQINADGTIIACWRCNKDPTETTRIGNGHYLVDFTPLSSDIRGTPRSATPNDEIPVNSIVIAVNDFFDDFSSVAVLTRRSNDTRAPGPS